MKVKNESEVAQSCPTLSDPMDCSPPGSSIHGISQARALEWGAIAFSQQYMGYSKPTPWGLADWKEGRIERRELGLHGGLVAKTLRSLIQGASV